VSELAVAGPVLANSIGTFADLVAEGTPAPGGGSVAAYCGLLAASLGRMVCNLTIGKKKYAESEPRLLIVRPELERLSARLQELIAEDAASFEGVLSAYRLPKENDAQNIARAEAIQRALQQAVEVPLETAGRSMDVLRLLREIADIGNSNALSDVAVGAQLAQTAVRGASYNVAVNLDSILDRDFVSASGRKMNELTEQSKIIADQIEAKVQISKS
jgi:formiminotetrahydrofolate cyclodeaminase